MKHKDRGYAAMLILVVVVILAASNAAGPEADQPTAPPAPEGNTVTTGEVAADVSFDLKPDGCDFVCMARHWLGENVEPVELAEAVD